MDKLGRNSKGKQQGFTIIEIMISLAVGLFIFAGVLSVFVGIKGTAKETSSYGELQENARFAMSILTEDLLRYNYWGDYTGLLNYDSLGSVPAAPNVECRGSGANNGSYPTDVGQFRTLWGETSSATDPSTTNMSCIDDAAPNSDVLQLKRVISKPVAGTLADNFSYFVGNRNNGAIYKGSEAAPVIENSRTWQYQHHIYYVREGLPVLMKWRLTSQMINVPMVDGIERIYFMYGISTVTDDTSPGFGVINAYVSAANMTQALWDNTASRILAVKVYVLARSILPDNQYNNENTYTLGDQAPYTPADNFRRLLLSSTVTLYNSEKDIW